jgi:hypothetical protein
MLLFTQFREMSSYAVAPFSAAIDAPVLHKPCEVQ